MDSRRANASDRSVLTRLARYAWIPTAAIVVAGLVFLFLSLTTEQGRSTDAAGTTTILIMTVTLLPIGALVARRQPANPIGWVFTATAFFFSLGFTAYEYALFAYVVNPGTPGVTAAAWFETWFWLPALFMPVTLLLLLFPDGHLLSPRWRPVLWLTLAGLAVGTVSAAIVPGPLDGIEFAEIDNPLGVDEAAEIVSAGAMIVLGLSAILSFTSLVLRLRRAHGQERERLRFVVRAFAVCVAIIVAAFPAGDWGWPLIVLGIAGIPIATGIAVIRHGLWDIDVIVRKTLVYGGVSALLVGLYFGIVIGLQAAFSGFTRGNDLAIAGSTLAVAALFRPARTRIQELVDRRFYRRRYDAEQTLAVFSARLRDEIDLDTLGSELGGVVRETMQPAHVSLWLRRSV